MPRRDDDRPDNQSWTLGAIFIDDRKGPREWTSRARPPSSPVLLPGLGVATVLAEAGANVHGQTVNVAEPQSVELWPLLWPLEATLDALCTLGAQTIRGVKRLLFASFSHFSGKQKKSWNRLTKPLLYRGASGFEAAAKIQTGPQVPHRSFIPRASPLAQAGPELLGKGQIFWVARYGELLLLRRRSVPCPAACGLLSSRGLRR